MFHEANADVDQFTPGEPWRDAMDLVDPVSDHMDTVAGSPVEEPTLTILVFFRQFGALACELLVDRHYRDEALAEELDQRDCARRVVALRTRSAAA